MIKLSTRRFSHWLAGLLLLTFATSLQAQVTTRQSAGGLINLNQFGALGLQGGAISTLELAPLDVARLRLEDQQYQKNGRPLRVAVQQNTNVDLPGTTTATERNGYRIYRYEVLAPGAGALSAIFDQLQLAEGARVFLYNPAQTVLVGPITSQQNITNNTFTSGHVTGDRIVIELQEPTNQTGQSKLHLSGVANFYEPRGPFGGLRPAGACENNQACFPDYQSEADGVALLLVNDGAGGLFLCTGSTVNDARQSFRSFFLTAFHCTDFNGNQINEPNEANSTAGWTFYFKYQSAACTPNTDDNEYVTINGATYRSGSAASDFTLVELNAQAPQSENISFLGWDRSSNLASSVFGIHHPNGSLKKISFGGATTAVGVTYFPGGNYNVVSGTSFLQLSWNNGVTEGGSSGSALFDGTSRRVIGQLLGGSSFCSSPTAPDQYGRFFTSWTGGGSDATRLSNWLDPTGISGNTTNIAVPTVSGPAAFTGTGSFALNTLNSSITSWSIVGANASNFSQASGSGNVANLTATANASNVIIRFTVNAGQSYPIQFTKTFDASVAPPANQAPVAASNTNQTATVGTAFTYTVNAFTDPNNDALTYTASGLPMGLMFDPMSRIISGTPTMAQVSSVTVTATDPGSLSASTTFTITVNAAPPANQAPTTSGIANQVGTVGQAFSLNLASSFSDPNSDALTLVVSGLPTGLIASGSTISGTPTVAEVKSVTVTATDPGNLSVTTTFSFNVNPAPPVNQPPVPSMNMNQTATVGVAFTYTVSAFTDPNGDALTYTASGLPMGLMFNSTSRAITGTPTTVETKNVIITATDPGSLSASTTFTITVNPAPVTPPPTGPATLTITSFTCFSTAGALSSVNFVVGYSDGTFTPALPPLFIVGVTADGQLGVPYSFGGFDGNVGTLPIADNATRVPYFVWDFRAACSAPVTPPAPTPPVAPVLPNQTATQGTFFSYVVPAFTGTMPIAYSATGLPAGLNFDANSRIISGTPSMTGVSTVVISATNAAGQGSGQFTITVNPAPVTPPPTGPATLTITSFTCFSTAGALSSVNFVVGYSDGTFMPALPPLFINGVTASGQLGQPYTFNFDGNAGSLPIQDNATRSTYFVWNFRAACAAPATPVIPPPTGPTTLTITSFNCFSTAGALSSVNFVVGYSDGTFMPALPPLFINGVTANGQLGQPYTFNFDGNAGSLPIQDNASRSTYFVWDFRAACASLVSSARLSAESTTPLQMRVLGNPVSNTVEFEITGAEGGSLNLALSDMQGRTVGQQSIERATATERVRFNVGDQPTGMLLLRATTPMRNQTLRLLKAE